MGFWKHYIALWKKNLIVYKRNWKGSVCEICCPIFLMVCVLILRLALTKTKKDPDHMLKYGAIWYDNLNGPSDQDFLSYEFGSAFADGIAYCTDRDFGPDRTIIALAPSGNSMITEIKNAIENDLSTFGDTVMTVQVFSSRDAIMDVIKSSSYEKDDEPGICFGGAFTKTDSDDYQVNMIFDDVTTERSEDSNMPNQRLDAVDKYQREPNKDAYEQYSTGGYIYLQNLFANALLRQETGDSSSYVSMIVTPLKRSEYNDDSFADAASDLWSFFMSLIFLVPLYRFISNSVSEKETKIREAMKIMGLTDLPYWLSWLSYYALVNTVQCIIMLLLMIPVFEYSNLFLVFLYFWLYGMSLFGFGLFVTSFFSSAKTAAIVGTMLFYLTSFLTEMVQEDHISESAKVLCSFFPVVAVQLAGYNLIEFEASGIGLTFDNANELFKNYRFSTTLWMNVISFFVFGLLGLYLENVMPSAVGVRKPLLFPFMKSYWCGSKKSEHQQEDYEDSHRSNKVGNSCDLENSEENKREIHQDYFEDVPEYLRRKEDDNQFIKIRNLKKKFGENFYAINDLNAEMYEDQIFALLGHNGAGKTTTISALCGMIAPSSGSASIYGYSIKDDMKEIRKITGFCPQHNILFPKLTVREHLSIFCDFKGMNKKNSKNEIEQLLKDLNLESKANYLSMNLSGGYKRKLSLGIALCGGSKVVFLDEPSSGMDVTARREMWDMLKKYKNDRIIILTTHYMEEADNLGDRIGIMSHGQMVCCGTADFLKNKFGEGYNLIVVKDEREDNARLEEFITSNVPNAKKVSEVSSEATYLLPKDSADSFGEFFKRLDQQSKDLGVESYGVSMTTLEEVFLQVEGDLQEDDKKKVENLKRRLTSNLESNKNELNADNYSIAKEQISGAFSVFMLHFGALFLKRLLLSKRNFKAFLIELLIPGMLVIAGFGISTIDFFIDSDERILEPDLFPLEQRIFYNTNGISGGGDPETLIDLLEPSSAFSPTGVSSSIGSTDLETLENFDSILYDEAQEDPLKPYRFGSYYFHSLDYTSNQYEIVTFANITSQEAAVAFPQFMYEAVLKRVSGSGFQYTMVNDPMPIVQIFKDRDKGGNGMFLGFVLGIAYALIPTSIIGFILNEKVNALIHQQIISGMNKTSYWTANYVFDVLKTFVTIIISIIFLYAFNLDLDYAWLLLILFPTAIVAYTYATSFFFSEEGSAQNFTILHHFFIGGLVPIAITVLRLISSTQDVGDVLIWPFRIIPTYNVCGGFVFLSTREIMATIRDEDTPNELSAKVIGGDVVMLVLHPFIWIGLLILFEKGCFKCLRYKGASIVDEQEQIDNDVLEEQDKVEKAQPAQLAVKADHLRKVYGNSVAVKDVSFGLEFGDCFCLLGVNGAGKTTTFKMLTGDVDPTKGESHIVGHNVRHHFEMARRQIGYCPQFDAIFNLMTVREHLEFYSKIKKIPKHLRESLILNLLKAMNLEQYENKIAGSLSGGNKRKLSVAMAMIGNPPVVFLDEPSAGMDPKARRFMWEIIAKISTRGKNSAVILTTHSMEEAEALSTNMGIMVAGQFKCFGSKQHIKNKFGTGYQVEIKFKAPQADELDQIMTSLNVLSFLQANYNSCYKIEIRKGQEILLANKNACMGILRDLLKNERVLSEFTEEGFGREIVDVLNDSGYYPVTDLIKWEKVMKSNLITLGALVNEFGEALLLEQYAPRYRYRVPKGDKSVGYFFSFMGSLKDKLDVDEYSASQTTLEQIFNGFARLENAEANQRNFTKQDVNNMISHHEAELSEHILGEEGLRKPQNHSINSKRGIRDEEEE